jgi:hypothetical protein
MMEAGRREAINCGEARGEMCFGSASARKTKPIARPHLAERQEENAIDRLRKLEEEAPFGKYAKAAQPSGPSARAVACGRSGRIRQVLKWRKQTSSENGQVLMTTPGSLTGWAHLSARDGRIRQFL